MRLAAILAFLFVSLVSHGQILNPAKWSFSVSNTSPKTGDEIDLVFKANIDKNWYLYSSEFPCEDGPIKTTITLKPNGGYKLVGGVKAIDAHDKHDEIFDCDVKIFKGTGEFRQRIKILSPDVKLEGEVDYQVCSDVDGKCIPGNEEFSFPYSVPDGYERIYIN